MGPKDIWSISKPYRPSFNSNVSIQKLNQFIEISMSVAWGWSAVWLRGTKAEGLAALLGALGTMGLLSIGRGSGMPAIMFYC